MSTDAALERKLRPLYEAIDGRQFKQALKLAAAALQKYPNNQLIRALKSVTLQRMGGRDEEALELADEVAKETPTDEQVLYTLGLTWQGAGKLKCISAAYEAASNLDPKNRALVEQMFGGFVREGNLVKQQQAAMKIYRMDQCEKHLLWVATTLLLQGRGGATDGAKLLALAEAMLKKCADSGGISSQEALFIYLKLLHEQGKHAAAMEMVKGPIAARCLSLKSDALRLEGDVAVKAGDWPAAAAAQEAILNDNPDDWLALVAALDAFYASEAAGLPPSAGAAEGPAGLPELLQRLKASPERAEAAHARAGALVSSLVAAADARGGSHAVGRGPYLALVEAAARRVEIPAKQSPGDAARALAEAVLAHWSKLGDMVSCCADLRAYTRRLTRGDAEAARAWLCERLRAGAADEEAAMGAAVASNGDGAGLGDDGKKAHVKAVTRSLFRFGAAHALLADLGAYSKLPIDEASKGASALLRATRSTLFVNAGADKREHTPSDVLFLLAAEALASAAQAQKDDAAGLHALLGATGALVEGLQNSPHNAVLLLALVALFSVLCAGSAAFEVWSKLEAKHIQWDTISHHILPVLMACGLHGELLRALKAVRKLHTDHTRDSGEMVLLAMQHGTFDKAVEFVDFRDRLAASLTFAACSAELAAATGLHAVPQQLPQGKGAAAAAPLALSLLEGAEAQAAASARAAALIPDTSAGALARSRFNWDLATQPAFLGAPDTSYGSAIQEWWGRAGGPCGGARADWAPGAPEGGSEGRRDSLRAALVARAEVAKLVAAVGAGLSGEGRLGMTAQEARACQARLRAALRGDWTGAADAGGKPAETSASSADGLALVAASAFAALAAVFETESAEDAGAAVKEAAAQLAEWAAALTAASGAAAAALKQSASSSEGKAAGLPLSAGAMASAARLLYESLPLAVAAAQSVLPALAPGGPKQGKGAKGGKAGGARDRAGDAALAEALRGLAGAAKRAALEVGAPVLASLAPPAKDQIERVQELVASSAIDLPAAVAAEVADKVVHGQRAGLSQLQHHASLVSDLAEKLHQQHQ